MMPWPLPLDELAIWCCPMLVVAGNGTGRRGSIKLEGPQWI
jgi:hypothetical protein